MRFGILATFEIENSELGTHVGGGRRGVVQPTLNCLAATVREVLDTDKYLKLMLDTRTSCRCPTAKPVAGDRPDCAGTGTSRRGVRCYSRPRTSMATTFTVRAPWPSEHIPVSCWRDLGQ